MTRVLPVILVLITASAVCAQEPLRTAGPRPVDVRHIRLDLSVDLPRKQVDATAFLRFGTLRPTQAITLDAVGFEVKSVALGSVSQSDKNNPDQDKPRPPLEFRHDGKQLAIELPAEWRTGLEGWLVIDYRIRDPKDGLYFFGPTASEPDVPLTVWSQGEPVTNRYWIPCLDHPDQRQTTELIVTVADGFEVLSNGRLAGKKANADKTVTFHWKQEQPHVSYLVTLVVGKFDVERESWNGKEVSYYVPAGRRGDIDRTFRRTRDMMTFFSQRFGVEYPWAKYAQVVVEQFSAGGMENTTATTLTERALLTERAAVDQDAEGLIAHELAHQWWGDLVTCRDWAHLWLNEGWASFCEVLWDEHARGNDQAALNLLAKARGVIGSGTARERPIVDRRYPSPMTMFDARAYPKGAWVLHMLRAKLGDDLFWKGVKAYATEHRLKSVETSDFRRTMERVSGMNLERFFYDWTERPGWPVLEVKVEYLSNVRLTKITVKQTQAGEPFQFDLPVNYVPGGSTAKDAWQDERFPVTEKEHTFYLRTGPAPHQVEIDPQQTILAEWRIDQGRDFWANALKSSPGAAYRARAAEYFGKSKAPQDRELLAERLKNEPFWGVAMEIARALGESGGDSSRDALVLGLKHREPRVRRACADAMGAFVGDEKAVAALRDLLKRGDASESVEAAALHAYARVRAADAVAVLLPWLAKPSHNEALRVAALKGLGDARDLSALDSIVEWTNRGKPRDARIGALQALAAVATTANPDDAQRKTIATAIGACLEGESPPVRRAAAEAIRNLGRAASPSLDVLEMIARHDPNEFVAETARKAVEAIRANTPAPVEVTRLREELEKLKKANDDMRKRLDRFEKMEKK